MVNTISWKYRNDTWPIVTSYEGFSAYSIIDAWYQTYQSQEQVDVMEVDWSHKVTKKWKKLIADWWYLAWWRWRDMWSSYWGGEVLVVFQTNANADILAYVIKTSAELWDDWYTYAYAFMWWMTDAIWDTMLWWFSTTLTVSTSSWTITISDGNQSILVNTTSHAMRYNADYYDWSSNTSTEYSTLQTNWWLEDWTYSYQWINQDWSDIITSLKAKWIVNATITHDAVNGEITIANGQWSITIADKNLWATQVYNNGDTLSEANCGKYYQRWNNYWFPWDWSNVTISSTNPDLSAYWPWNYYSSSTFINSWVWYTINTNLWWGVSWTEGAMQWPCPSWFHIPSANEISSIIDFYNVVYPNWGASWFQNAFKLPSNKRRRGTSSSDSGCYLWWATHKWDISTNYPCAASLNISYDYIYPIYELQASNACWIRPFKNTYTLIPINQLWSEFWDTTDIQNEMNSHPYDYYLLGWCTTPLTLASWAWAMRRVYASYNTSTNTWSVEEVV